MVYKRLNKTLEDDTRIEYVESNNQGIYINSSVTGANFAPYHGIYINQSTKQNDIYLSKMIETVIIGHDKYNIMDIKTSESSYGGVEYLEEFTNVPVPTYIYNINGCSIVKKYKLSENSKLLCIEYCITNNTGKVVKINAMPCVTKRPLITTKRQSDMRYTSAFAPTATKIALSISENINLYIKSPNMRYDKKENYISGVNSDYEDSNGNIKTFVEDLFVPGFFEAHVKNGNTSTFSIFVTTEDINVQACNSHDIELDIIGRDEIRYRNIDKTYYELLALAKTAHALQYIDKEKRQFVLLESMPPIYDSKEYVKNMIVSIEGNYLLLGRYKEAHKILESMMYKLKDETYKLEDIDRCEAILLYIEALNRYLAITEAEKEEIREFYLFIKKSIYEFLDKKYTNMCIDTDELLMIEGKKYIKVNALWYNALRIFVDLADKFGEESEFIYSVSENVRNKIIECFWNEERSVLRYEAHEQPYATVDMIYSLSLSYQVVYDNNVSMKLMDTAFKKLYTAYGMRLGEIGSKYYDGFVYPHLLVHFLKANLRQMGVTRASQKLAYNLVKDVFFEIGKKTVGTVKYKYNEKTKKPIGNTISAMTNAELIRAFDMLT